MESIALRANSNRVFLYESQDDMPPVRLMTVPISDGPWKGEVLEEDAWNQMLTDYYETQGWDPATGWQTAEMLEHIGLPDVAEKLRRFDRLPSSTHREETGR